MTKSKKPNPAPANDTGAAPAPPTPEDQAPQDQAPGDQAAQDQAAEGQAAQDQAVGGQAPEDQAAQDQAAGGETADPGAADAAAEANDAGAAAGDGAPEKSTPWEPTPEALAEALKGELAEANDKLLRALAETENVRRRGDKEKSDALNYGAANFAKDMLGVADNLRRALDAIPADAIEADGTLKALATGVEMTESELMAAFERHGIKPIEAEGAKFDHNLHQAMMEVPGSGQPAGTVVQVLQTGFTIHDRLLRPAMVGVAKGDAPAAAKDGDGKGDGRPGGKGSKLDTSA